MPEQLLGVAIQALDYDGLGRGGAMALCHALSDLFVVELGCLFDIVQPGHLQLS
jgi:hypothetical protein